MQVVVLMVVAVVVVAAVVAADVLSVAVVKEAGVVVSSNMVEVPDRFGKRVRLGNCLDLLRERQLGHVQVWVSFYRLGKWEVGS